MKEIIKDNSLIDNKIDYKKLTKTLSNKLPQYASLISESIMPLLIGKKDIAQIEESQIASLNESDLESIGMELVYYLKSELSNVSDEMKNQIIECYSSLAGQIIREKDSLSTLSLASAEAHDFIDTILQKKIMKAIDNIIDSQVEDIIRAKIQSLIKRIMIEEIQKL